MLMTNQQAAELAEPGVGWLHDPSPLIAAKFAAVFVSPFPVVAAIRHDQFDPSLPKPLAQAVGIVSFVGDHALGLLPRATLRSGDASACLCNGLPANLYYRDRASVIAATQDGDSRHPIFGLTGRAPKILS